MALDWDSQWPTVKLSAFFLCMCILCHIPLMFRKSMITACDVKHVNTEEPGGVLDCVGLRESEAAPRCLKIG